MQSEISTYSLIAAKLIPNELNIFFSLTYKVITLSNSLPLGAVIARLWPQPGNSWLKLSSVRKLSRLVR